MLSASSAFSTHDFRPFFSQKIAPQKKYLAFFKKNIEKYFDIQFFILSFAAFNGLCLIKYEL
jgi:hypothetical protein